MKVTGKGLFRICNGVRVSSSGFRVSGYKVRNIGSGLDDVIQFEIRKF